MPQGSELLQFIRGMTREELNAVRRRCDWCRVRKFENKRDLSKRVKDSIKRSVDNGQLTYAEAMGDIRREVLIPRPATTEQMIRRTLKETPVSAPVGDIRLEEEWLSAQLYGSLYAKFEPRQQYDVYIEYPLNHRTRSQADLYIEDAGGDGDFIIEVKRAGEIDNGNKVERQLEKYFRDIDNRRDLSLQKAFLCIIGETDPSYTEEETENMELSDFVDIPSTLDDLQQRIDDLEVVLNRQELSS